MDKYKVIIEPTAENDLYEIFHYIGGILHEPRSAERIYFAIKDQVSSLSEMPLRYPLIQEEPYRSMGVRRIQIESYTAFYLVNENDLSVHVFRILYSRREWKNLI